MKAEAEDKICSCVLRLFVEVQYPANDFQPDLSGFDAKRQLAALFMARTNAVKFTKGRFNVLSDGFSRYSINAKAEEKDVKTPFCQIFNI
jgi:hypothetical protein